MKLCTHLDQVFDISTDPAPMTKEHFRAWRKKRGDDKEFFLTVIQYLGGRGYNVFLDYSLLAIKLHPILQEYDMRIQSEESENSVMRAMQSLMGGDRHDLWQNLPYYLGSGMTKKEWEQVVDVFIQCINVHGTEDAFSLKFEVPEH